jgi:hypothetical protein
MDIEALIAPLRSLPDDER